jgi:hypothetical protein
MNDTISFSSDVYFGNLLPGGAGEDHICFSQNSDSYKTTYFHGDIEYSSFKPSFVVTSDEPIKSEDITILG